MKTFYFVGGPKPGRGKEFFQRLAQVGGSPPNWQVFPHVANDGKALHVASVDSLQGILDHLQHFQEDYEYSEIIEVRVSVS